MKIKTKELKRIKNDLKRLNDCRITIDEGLSVCAWLGEDDRLIVIHLIDQELKRRKKEKKEFEINFTGMITDIPDMFRTEKQVEDLTKDRDYWRSRQEAFESAYYNAYSIALNKSTDEALKVSDELFETLLMLQKLRYK